MRLENGKLYGVLDDDGELSDEAAHHILNVIQTKAAILKYIEPIAQVLAAAGEGSRRAMGHAPDYAIDEWLKVIGDRAKQIVSENRLPRRIESAKK